MKSIKQLAWGLILLGLLPLSMNARSASVVQVDVDGKTWDVTYVYGNWSELKDLLVTQPWWCQETCESNPWERLGVEFAEKADLAGIDLVNDYSDAPWFNDDVDRWATPFFLEGVNEDIGWMATAMSYGNRNLDPTLGLHTWQSAYFAVASPHAVPIPGTLGLLGIGLAGLGFVRRKAKA